jgi:hypothetical protein
MSAVPSPGCGSPCCECPTAYSLTVPCMLSALLGGPVSAWFTKP